MSAAAKHDDGPSEALLDAATDWRMRMERPDWSGADEAELEAWLAADPMHETAFQHTGDVWAYFDEQAASPAMMRARRDAIQDAQKAAGFGWARPGRRRIAAALAAVVVGAAVAYPFVTGPTVYQTGLGERRAVLLKDGSRLSLDALTKVSVDYSKSARRLKLLRGQARFDVAHDVTRPFSVAARDRTVIATGTAFNIDIVEPGVRVTLIKGHVIVLSAPAAPTRAPAKPVELNPGDQLTSPQTAAPPRVAKVDLGSATAWQDGKLVFTNEPLADAVLRVNRYSARKIVVGDAGAAAVRVSGIFDVGDTDSFVDAVTDYLPVTAQASADEVMLKGRAGG